MSNNHESLDTAAVKNTLLCTHIPQYWAEKRPERTPSKFIPFFGHRNPFSYEAVYFSSSYAAAKIRDLTLLGEKGGPLLRHSLISNVPAKEIRKI